MRSKGRMELNKLTGLVLDKKDLANGDREILFLDKNKGKISLLVKGIAKSKNREVYSTDMLVFSEFISYDTGIISKVCLLDPLNALKDTNFKLKSSLYILLIVKEIIPFHGGREIYNLVGKMLFYLKRAHTQKEILSIVLIFFITLIKNEGLSFAPNEKNFDLVMKSGIIDSKNFKEINAKKKFFLEILKNSNYEKIVDSNLNLKELLIILKLLEIHINDFLNLNIDFENFMKGFSNERD